MPTLRSRLRRVRTRCSCMETVPGSAGWIVRSTRRSRIAERAEREPAEKQDDHDPSAGTGERTPGDHIGPGGARGRDLGEQQ